MGVIAGLGRLIIVALVGLVTLLVLIIGVRLQAVLATLISAAVIGLVARMSHPTILEPAGTDTGNTLKGITLLVGLGSVFGAVLEIFGGAQRTATTLVDKFGESKAAWTLGITGLVITMLVFFDAGLIILIPLTFSLVKETRRSTFCYAISLLAGLAVGYTFIPPIPGPIPMANMPDAELEYMIIVDLLAGTVVMIVAGPVLGKSIGSKIYVSVPKSIQEMEECGETKLPGFLTVVSTTLIPLALIISSIIPKVVPVMAGVQLVLALIGEPFTVLTIMTPAATTVLGIRRGYSREELEKVMTKSLEPTDMTLLVTAHGGVLRYALQGSDLGEAIDNVVAGSALPLVVVAFAVAAPARMLVGSTTVVMTMGAGIIVVMSEAASLSPLHLTCVTATIAGGTTVMSHFNDSGFWLMKSLLQVDEKMTLKDWTAMEMLVGASGFVVMPVTSLFVQFDMGVIFMGRRSEKRISPVGGFISRNSSLE